MTQFKHSSDLRPTKYPTLQNHLIKIQTIYFELHFRNVFFMQVAKEKKRWTTKLTRADPTFLQNINKKLQGKKISIVDKIEIIHYIRVFLVGAFSFWGKMPDYSSDLFFSFFLQTTILTLLGPLFTILRRAPEAKSVQGKLYSKGPPLSFFTFSRKHTKPDVLKGSPLWIFFGTVRLFFEKFLMSPKGPPFEFFVILQRNVC